MKKTLILAAALLTAATPALAGESRIEARGGVAWASGDSEAVAGVAAGHDFTLGQGGTFFGVEASADKVLASGADVVFGLTGRLGTQVGDAGKLYVTSGYSFNDGDAFHAGAGYQHNLGNNMYGKVEYRRFFHSGTDVNTAAIGVGIRF